MKIENIKIEKGVPIPENNLRYIDILGKLEIGDSIFIEEPKINNVRSNTFRISKELNRHFISRKDGSGTRIWRDK